MDARQIWQAALGELQLQMTKATFDTWLKGTYALAYEDGSFVIAVHNTYAKEWLENRLYSPIKRTLTGIVGRAVEMKFVVRAKTAPEPEPTPLFPGPEVPDATVPLSSRRSLANRVSDARQVGASPLTPDPWPSDKRSRGSQLRADVSRGERDRLSMLNPKYTFETFIVGSGNRMAHAAALAVAENPAQRYNPLFIYGGVGLGKTHLLHAVGHIPLRRNLRVLYVTSERFTNELINAIRNQTTEEFRHRYRLVDILLVDDIHFIAGKESTQEEFFHTFNTLHEADKQIVITSDRHPRAISTLEERLCSRFQWGLIVDIQPPDLETRIAILRFKSESQPLPVPDGVIELIAHRIQRNIRELEGALNVVVTYAQVRGCPVTVDTATAALRSFVVQREPPTPEEILAVVAGFYKVEIDDLKGPSRGKGIVLPRQVVMYLMRKEAHVSLTHIGQVLGGRDHSTVLYGVEKIAAQLEEDERLHREMLAIKESLYNHVNYVPH
ncbi:MAG: chromosomal replication initiator protein DnaA [Anaerolineae bacterium]